MYVYIYIYIRMLIYHPSEWCCLVEISLYIYIHRLVQASGTTYDGVGGWGGMLTFMWTCGRMLTFMWTCGRMLTFMWTCGSSWCYAHTGWGGVGWDVNVRVNLRLDVNVHVNLRQQLMMMMMMMMTTLMKLVNSATKFHHGMDKFYQPNSGLRGSRSRDEAIYTYIYI